MEFIVSNDELFLKIDIAAKFLTPYGDNSSFLQSLVSNVKLYTPLEGMYLAVSLKESFTIFCRGFARLDDFDYEPAKNMYWAHSSSSLDLEDWRNSPCHLSACQYTEGKLPHGNKHKYSLAYQGDNYPKNGDYINFAYVSVAELADYCEQVGFQVQRNNIEEVCFLACKFNSLDLFFDHPSLEQVKEQSFFTFFSRYFPVIESDLEDTVIERIRDKYTRYIGKLVDETSKKSNNIDDIGITAPKTTDSTFRTLGALLALLKETNMFKSDADLIRAIEDKYFGVRGLSRRTLEDNFKKGKDALEEAQKR